MPLLLTRQTRLGSRFKTLKMYLHKRGILELAASRERSSVFSILFYLEFLSSKFKGTIRSLQISWSAYLSLRLI